MVANEGRRIVFLCSGGGGNLAFVHQAIAHAWLPGTCLVGVIADRVCLASDFAGRVGLSNSCVDFREQGQRALMAALEELQPDLIVTTVNKILGRTILERYTGQLINLHYSLLPAFAGLIGAQPVQAALDHYALFAGVTVHRVDEEVDSGRPLVQGVIDLHAEDTLETLMPVVFRSGCFALLRAITARFYPAASSYSPVDIEALGRNCRFNGGSAIEGNFPKDEEFWLRLRRNLADGN